MGFLSNLLTPAPIPVAAHSTLADLIVADALQNGYTDEAALGVAAVFRARAMNADTPAALEVKVGESLVPAPNATQDTQEFITETILALQDYGDAYWRVTFDGDMTVIPNRDVIVRWDTNRKKRLYSYRNTNIQFRTEGAVPNLRVISVNRGAGDLTGKGWMQSDAIKGIIAIQQYSQEYFENNGNPTGVLSTPGVLTKPEADRLKSQWVDARTIRTPAVLSGGMQWDGTSFSASDSTWVQSQESATLSVAAISGVPAHFLAASPSGSSLTYTNLSDLYEGFWRMTLWPQYIARITRAWTAVLGQQVTFDPEPLFLASMKDRVYSVSELVRTGFNPADSLDEVGLPPIGHTGEVPVTLQQERTA